jgi:agmatinase
MLRRVEQVTSDVMGLGKMPVMLGGEHSITVGAVRAAKRRYSNLSVLQLDAHADLRNRYLESTYNHACVMRRVVEICPAVQAGIRSMSREEAEYVEQNELKAYYAQDMMRRDAADDIIASLSANVYITIDLDVFDPSIMSAVGTPQPGGLDWYIVIDLLRRVSQARHVVGFDLVELCPSQGPVSCAFLAAKLAYKLIGYTCA